MRRHLARCERLGHQRRITDHELDTRLCYQAVHQPIDAVLVLRVINEHEGVRTREHFLYLRLCLGREEDRRLLREVPRQTEQDNSACCHRQFMPGDEARHRIGRRYISFLRGLVDRTAEE